MKILAIDPGNIESAYVVWDGQNILNKGYVTNLELIKAIHELGFHDCEACVIEMVASYGMSVGKSVFDTCVWIGRLFEAWWIDSGFEASLVYRKDIKLHLCGQVRAKDSNVRQSLIDRFEPELQPRQRPKKILKGLKKDEWQAFALAVHYFDTYNT